LAIGATLPTGRMSCGRPCGEKARETKEEERVFRSSQTNVRRCVFSFFSFFLFFSFHHHRHLLHRRPLFRASCSVSMPANWASRSASYHLHPAGAKGEQKSQRTGTCGASKHPWWGVFFLSSLSAFHLDEERPARRKGRKKRKKRNPHLSSRLCLP